MTDTVCTILRDHIHTDIVPLVLEYLHHQPQLMGLCVDRDHKLTLHMYQPHIDRGEYENVYLSARWVVTQSVLCYCTNFNVSTDGGMRVLYELIDLNTMEQVSYPVDNIWGAGIGTLRGQIYVIGGGKTLRQPLHSVYILKQGTLIKANSMQYSRCKPVCVSGYGRIYAIGSGYTHNSSILEEFDGVTWECIDNVLPPAFGVNAATVTPTHLIIIGVVDCEDYTCIMMDTTTYTVENIAIPPDFNNQSVLLTLNESIYCINKRTPWHKTTSVLQTDTKTWLPYNIYDIREDIVFSWVHGIDIL